MIGKKITSGKRIGAFLVAAALVVGTVFAPSLMKSVQAETTLKETYGLTVEPCSKIMMDGSETEPGDAEVKDAVVVDLYKVAEADPDPNFYTYHFKVDTSEESTQRFFKAFQERLSAPDITAGDYETMAKEMTPIALNPDNGFEPVTVKMDEQTDIAPGLYLMVARGAAATTADYDKYYNEKDGTTFASTSNFIYTYQPQLIFLPTTRDVIDEDTEQPIMTSDGEWFDATTIFMKPTRIQDFGDLELIKRVLTFDATREATFVYQVDVIAVPDSYTGPWYSSTVTFTFDEAGQKEYLLADTLPVGATVRVTEIYDGANYEQVSPASKSQEVVILPKTDPNYPASVTFENDYSSTDRAGGSITNKMNYMKTSDGEVIQLEEQAKDSGTTNKKADESK